MTKYLKCKKCSEHIYRHLVLLCQMAILKYSRLHTVRFKATVCLIYVRL